MSFLKRVDQKFRAWNHRRIDAFRRWRLNLFLTFFNQKNAETAAPNNTILILRLDGKLGDTITTSGFMQSLTAAGFNVEIVTRVQNAFVYEFMPKPFSLHVLNKGFSSFLKLFFTLKKNQYSALFCSTHILDPASLFFSRFVRAQKKIVYMNEQIQFFDTHITRNFLTVHVTERLHQAFEAMTGKTENLKPYKIEIPEAATKRAEIFYSKLQGKKVIVLNSFAGAKLRNFSLLTTKAIVENLSQKYFVISIGNEGDLNILREWKKQITSPNWFVPDLGDFAFNSALIKLSDLVITPDTSIVHLASALDKPLLAVYRKDEGSELNSKIWAPKNKRHRIIYAPNQDINSVDLTDIFSKIIEVLN